MDKILYISQRQNILGLIKEVLPEYEVVYNGSIEKEFYSLLILEDATQEMIEKASQLANAPVLLIISKEIKTKYNYKTFIKPIKINELIEHIRKAARHSINIINIGPYRFNKYKKQFYIDNKIIELTEKETQLIEYLYNAKKTVNKKKLLNDIWGYNSSIDTHTLETHIYRLRRKLECDDLILTQDSGYLINYLEE